MKKRTKSNTFYNNYYMIKLLLKICPARVVATLFRALIDYFAWVFFSIIFLKYIFHSIDIKRSFSEIVVFVLISIVAFLLLSLYSSWYDKRYKPITDQIIRYRLNKILFDKTTSVDIGCYENPEFYNNYISAVAEANSRAIDILDNISNIISASISSLFVVYTMFTLDITSMFFVIIPVVSSFIFNKLSSKIKYKNYQEDIPHNRRKEYVGRTIFLKKYAKEIRLTNIFNVIKNVYDNAYDGIYNNIDKYKNKSFIFGFSREFLSFPVAFESVWLYAAYRVIVAKNLTMSDFIVIASAIVSITHMLLGLTNNIVSAIQNGLYVNNFRSFLSYKEKISEDQDGILLKDDVSTLEFVNVSFTYEGQTRPVLNNINLKISSNETISLVGHNGAGKTTLIKLAMRLYDVTEGEILLNGINIKSYNVQGYRRLFSTVFQNFQVMAMSILENVLMKDVKSEAGVHTCEEALKKSGLYDKVSKLPNGIHSILTREFDDNGIELSGGENQKIAIARAIAKNSPIIILDEPSSALDPISEYEMYESLSKLYQKKDQPKLVILISHRLSCSLLADKVYMLENGEIIEEGTHKSLIRDKGKYYELYMKQAKSYVDDDIDRKMDFIYEEESVKV